MTEYTQEALDMFHAIAKEHGCAIDVQLEKPVEVLCELSRTDSPNNVVLGLQNGDELNFGVHDFWSFFFPYNDVKSLFRSAVSGWFHGRSRLVYFFRGNRLLKIELQVKMKDGGWQRIYTDARTVLLPQWSTRTEIQLDD